VPRHIARLATRLVASLVVNYSTSCKLVVDCFASATRPDPSARRASRHAASRRPSSTTSTTPRVWVPRHVTRLVTQLVVDYFVYAVSVF
jgi:hypothetical protein